MHLPRVLFSWYAPLKAEHWLFSRMHFNKGVRSEFYDMYEEPLLSVFRQQLRRNWGKINPDMVSLKAL